MSTLDKSTELIDFTLMYATHNAFRRDLARLVDAVGAGRTNDPRVQAGWQNFKRQLDVHHTIEDSTLWPPVLRAVADRPRDTALMHEMAAEHQQLDPVLASVDDALRTPGSDASGQVRALSTILGNHMKHEEDSALPLIQDVLTLADWGAFRSAMARRQGPAGAAVYVPWILDDTTPEQRRDFLAAMPRPLSLINRMVFEPRYRKRRLWAT